MAKSTKQLPTLDAWNKDQYLKFFGLLETGERLMGKLPSPGPSTLKFYQRAVGEVDAALVKQATIDWVKTALRGYTSMKANNHDWFEAYLEYKPEPVVKDRPSVTGSASPTETASLIAEMMNDPLQVMGQSIGSVLRSIQREQQEWLISQQDGHRRALDLKFTGLQQSIVESLEQVVVKEIQNSVNYGLLQMSSAIAEATVAQLPAHITSMIRTTIDARLEELFGPVEPPKDPEAVVPPVVDHQKDPNQPTEAVTTPEPAPVAAKRRRVVRVKKDVVPLGSTDRSLKILILDLNKDQISRTRNGISEKWASLDMGKGAELNDTLVAKYDYIIGSHYTDKAIGKSAAQSWPDKYVLADGNFTVVRSAVQRLINEFRREVVVH